MARYAAPLPYRFAGVQRVMGLLLMAFSVTMLPPLLLSLVLDEHLDEPFLIGMWATLATGALLWWPLRELHSELKTRDGFLITTLFWSLLGLFGALPLYLSRTAWPTYTDAVFEAISGLTTTGATTVPRGLDLLPHALLYYRAQLHWLGGMGIIVLALAVLPLLGIGGMGLYKSETPGPMKDAKLTPRITGTARALWLIYVMLTAACGICYWLAGMTPFDAVCHAFSTLSTGGFSTHDASIGYFDSALIELIAASFALAGAVNFALHYIAWERRSLRGYWRDTEFKTFLALYLIFSVLTCVPLIVSGTYPDAWTALRRGIFQVVAFGTGTGFRTADPTAWPMYVPTLLVLCTFMMACAGGTSGGVKVVRLVLFVKQAMRELRLLVHPSAEVSIKLDEKVVPNDVVYAVGGFFSMYIGTTLLLTGAMQLAGLDAITAFSAVAAAINNAGPGLGAVSASVASVTPFGKWTLIVAMLAGRLEIFTLLVLFTRAFWRR